MPYYSDYSEPFCKAGIKRQLFIQPNWTIRPAYERANLVTCHNVPWLLLRDEQDLASIWNPLFLCYLEIYFSKIAWSNSDLLVRREVSECTWSAKSFAECICGAPQEVCLCILYEY